MKDTKPPPHRAKSRKELPKHLLPRSKSSSLFPHLLYFLRRNPYLNINFEEGEICAVRGPSGSGKSTLLHILGGLEYPTAGKVFYRGEDLFAHNDNQLSILRCRRLAAGEKGSLTITVRNTSDSQPVENIKLAFLEEGGELYPEGTGATYCRHIGAGGTFTWELAVTAPATAQSKPHPAVITMEYEDSQGQPVTGSDRIILPVRQPVRLEYEEPSLPPRVTTGDTVPFSLTLMNLGKSTIFNALLKFEIPGLAGGGSVLVGTISPGESAAGTTNFRVESAPLGEVSGRLTLSYEDEYGEQYEQEILLNTKIEQKKEVAPPTDETDRPGPRSPRWIWAAAAAAVLALSVFFVIRWQKEKKAREEDEMRL